MKLLDRLASDTVLNAAFEWLCHRRRWPTAATSICGRRGFDFLGFHFSRDGLTVAKATIEKFVAHATRLYEQERERPAGPSLFGLYVRRWVGWVRGGLTVGIGSHGVALRMSLLHGMQEDVNVLAHPIRPRVPRSPR